MARTGSETRELVAQTALRLFREQGYDKTTMRAIAQEAGVSLGNAYHYFDGKDALVHELYRQIQHEHADRVRSRLTSGGALADNLRVVWHGGIDVMAPYHDFGRTFIQHALPTGSQASPFSTESGEARDLAIGLLREVVTESRPSVPERIAETLPTALWLAYLGVTVYWVSDSSPDQRRTRALVDGLVPIIAKIVGLARLPIARGLIDDVNNLFVKLAKPEGETS